MTRKERILRMVQRQADDVTYAEVIDRLYLMNDIEIGAEQIARGEVIPHEQVFAELLAKNEKDKSRLVRKGKSRSSAPSRSNSQGRAANGHQVPQAAKSRRRATKDVS